MIHSDQVQNTVHHRLAQIDGVLRTDHHVAELARTGRHRGIAIDREREDVGLLGLPAVLQIERRDRDSIDELHGEMTVIDAGTGGRQIGEAQHLRRRQQQRRLADYVDLQHPGYVRARFVARSGAARSACPS